MNLQESQKKHIRSAFKKIKSKSDFLDLLNYAKKIVYGEKSKLFELKHLTYHSNPNINSKRYYQFAISKKSGGVRTINAPNKGLKSIQKSLNLIFQSIYDVSPNAYGFVPNKSIVDNAKIHAGSLYVYNIDLKDFFPSIDQARIWGRMQYPPFNLKGSNDKIEVANIIAALCCQEILVERLDDSGSWQKVLKNVLPQGAPTSPTLTNIICQSLDFYIGADIILKPAFLFAFLKALPLTLLGLTLLLLAWWLSPYFIMFSFVVCLAAWYRIIYIRTIEYLVTAEYIRISRGIFFKRVDQLEMYRIKDYVMMQPLSLQLFRLMDLLLKSTDPENPMIWLRGIPESGIIDTIRDRVQEARKHNQIYEVN